LFHLFYFLSLTRYAPMNDTAVSNTMDWMAKVLACSVTPIRIDPKDLMEDLQLSWLANLAGSGSTQMSPSSDEKAPVPPPGTPHHLAGDNVDLDNSELMKALRIGNMSSPALYRLMGSFSNNLVHGHLERHCEKHPHCCDRVGTGSRQPNPKCHKSPECWQFFRRIFQVKQIPRS
jgi:hypothetical protein